MSSHHGEAKHTGRAYSKGKNKKSRYYVSLQSEHCVHWALKWEASVKEQKRISCEGTTSVSSALCSLRSIHYLHLLRSYTKPCPLALWIDSCKGWVVVVVVGCQKKNKTSLSREHIYWSSYLKKKVLLSSSKALRNKCMIPPYLNDPKQRQWEQCADVFICAGSICSLLNYWGTLITHAADDVQRGKLGLCCWSILGVLGGPVLV